ncbi:MAG: tRNA (adenosine(37)-N6)-threonylcarbamoyltransferase complex dimerization subunit type 1 TsaB [candidate division WOR-3 bacterium]
MKILGIDTSTSFFSVCICDDNEILYELRSERGFIKNSSAANLFDTVQELFNNMEDGNIDAIALSIGPGMFTSLRVGLALAKGLYISKHIPICGVNTLEVIAWSYLSLDFIKNEKGIICVPVMEAFQGELFVAFFSRKGKIGQDMVCNPEELLNFINQKYKNKKMIIIGPGVKILKEYWLIKNVKKSLQIIESYLFYPSSSKVVYAALPKIKKGHFDDPELLEPYYIKKTSAEMKRGK